MAEPPLRELLEGERLLEEILRLREPPKRPWWEATGLMTSATAILTILITSIAGYLTQQALRTRETDLLIYQEAAKSGRETARQANAAIVNVLKLNEERLAIAEGRMDALSDGQLQEIVRATNKLQEAWREDRNNIDMDIYLAFDSQGGARKAWAEVRAAAEAQIACVESVYTRAQRYHAPRDACAGGQQELELQAEALRTALKRGYDMLLSARH
jgi:hypothetical protein